MNGQKNGWMDGWMEGRLEIPPYVLQDIGPLGPLPKKDEVEVTQPYILSS